MKDGGHQMRPPFCHRMNPQTRQHVNACVSLGTARLSLQVPVKDKYFLLSVTVVLNSQIVLIFGILLMQFGRVLKPV